MKFIKTIFGFLFSRFLWTLIGIALICALIWLFGPLVQVGSVVPLGSEIARLIAIGLVIVFWLVSMLLRQIRAARANRMFVTDLAAPPETPPEPGDENVAEVQEKFQDVLDQMKRSKVGGRKFLRDMPWYVIIGPPGTGKTTALRQSGLHFPIDLSDDLKGIGGTRNCDWFFTEDVVLIDTAGRLQNRADLMEELAKIVRVIRKKDPTAPHNTLLVLDATTGQNAVSQVEIFRNIADVSGLVMTKLDGTAKGGVLVSLADKFGLPIHAIGVGEQIDDLAPFDPEEFAAALTGLEV